MKIFVDGGAHAGETFEWVDRNNFDRVLLVEPNPIYWQACEQYGKVYPVALSDKYERAKFYTSLRTDWGNSLLTYKGDEPMDLENPIEVWTIDTAQWLEEVSGPEDRITLKLDIEGAEYVVLERILAHPVIARVEHMLIEWHPIPGLIEKKDDLLKRIEEAGIKYEEWPH